MNERGVSDQVFGEDENVHCPPGKWFRGGQGV